MYTNCLKRLFDVTIAAIMLVVCAPLFLLLALLIVLRLGRPVLFRQQRPGLHGTIFTLIKFRSMRDASDAAGNPLPDAARLTPFGKWLRATSLDELPEIWNVLCGDMSMVGPRPLLIEYLPRYSQEQGRRHDLRPGITGWAQIHGRNAISWPEKFQLDVWYVDNCSFLLDLKILCLTLMKVSRSEDITAPGHASARKFRGNEP